MYVTIFRQINQYKRVANHPALISVLKQTFEDD